MASKMSSSGRAPRTKPEFVEALLPKTNLSREELMHQNLEKLRLLHRALTVRPVRRALPANWKRFGKAGLIEIYVNQVMPWLGLGEGHTEYAAWNKDRLILEIQHYEIEVLESGVIYAEEPEMGPKCLKCGVIMIERTNRMTQETFWGCPLFPSCKETLKKEYGGVPATIYQKQMLAKQAAEKPAPSLSSGGCKTKVTDSGEEMDGMMLQRAVKTKLPEDDSEASEKLSWENLSEPGMKLTDKEIAMILEARKKN